MQEPSETSPKSWAFLAVISGILGVGCYLSSVVFKPVPWSIGRFLFFSIGPLTVISTVGLYKALEATASRLPLLTGCVLTVVGGAIVNVMAVVQDMQFTYFGDQIRSATDTAARGSLEQVLWGVNVVQSGLDVSWDIFMTTGTIFLGVALWSHPLYGKVFGGLGIAAGVGALSLNLITYPTAPASAGLIDLGPAVGLWYALILVRLLTVRERLGPQHAKRELRTGGRSGLEESERDG